MAPKKSGTDEPENAPATADSKSALETEVEGLLELRDQLKAEIEQLRTATNADVEPQQHVPEWKRYRVRATGRGFANNRLHDAGDEFAMIIDVGLDPRTGKPIKPPSWAELLDEGEPVAANSSLENAVDFAKDETPKSKKGFAAGVA